MASEEITRHGILIADPSPHMASLIAGMARSLGRRDIREANDAQRAMAELKRRPFDVLIVDDALDGMDGVAFTRQLRAATDFPNRDIPVIMMSAIPDAKRIAEARDAGITEFLRKPFAAVHLQSRLTSIEANPRGFIEAPTYNGPDRRRRKLDHDGEERRAPEDHSPKAS